MPRWRDLPRFAAALMLTAGVLAAQAAPPPPVDFRAPDGSRFVLLPCDGPATVDWVVATPDRSSDEPAGSQSLVFASAMASMRGTWRTGSLDAVAEPRVLAALDAALSAHTAALGLGKAQRAATAEQLQRARAAAAALCDPLAFRRVLAGAPAVEASIGTASGCVQFACTTTPEGIGRVAELLVERREQCALRGLDAEFSVLQGLATQRWERDPMAPLRAEALALAFAGYPLARVSGRPADLPPDRLTALAVWQHTQRPDRSVHVLVGNFDPQQVRPVLEQAFARTELGREPIAARPPLPPLLATRRSTVPANGEAACVVGWQLSGSEDDDALAAVARWLGDDAGWLRQQLQKRGRTGVQVTCRSHWPDPTGPGLFLIEARQRGSSAAGLADQLLAVCGEAALQKPDAALLQRLLREALQQREQESSTPRAYAQRVAAALLLHPDTPLPLPAPVAVKAPALQQLLGNLFGKGRPVVVERAPQ